MGPPDSKSGRRRPSRYVPKLYHLCLLFSDHNHPLRPSTLCLVMSATNPITPNTPSTNINNAPLQLGSLTVSTLESLRSKINSMIESISALQRTIEAGGQAAMPAWPDILSKYTILLSQSHNLAISLLASPTNKANGASTSQLLHMNPYESVVLHPSMPMTDAQFDNDVVPLLRRQQTTDVLRLENDTVRHLAEHMVSRGSLGVLGITPSGAMARPGPFGVARKPEYADVLSECEQIRQEHDERVGRAVLAIKQLKETFDWKLRVEVEQAEPEELDWDPRAVGEGGIGRDVEMGVEDEGRAEADKESNDSDDEEELEEVLGNGDNETPSPEPSQMQLDAPPLPF